MSKKKVVFDAYALLNSPEMSAYLDKQEAEQAEQKKRLVAEQEAKQRKTGSQQSRSVSDDELSPEALKRDNISQTTGDITGRANDVWQALKSGGAQLIQGAGWLANEAGAHDSGQFLQDIGQIGQEQALANMTQAGREAQKNGVFKEDLSGVNDDWGRGMAQGIAGSAVPSIVGAMLGAPIARGTGAAGEALLGRAAVSEGALGSVLDAAIKYTPAPVMRLAGALPGAAGAGAGEAAVTGATNGAQAYQEVMDAPIESLRKSPAFQSLSKELGSEDAARKAIADRMSIQTAKDTALSTGLIGAAMGGGAVGSLLNKFAVKQGAKEVGRLGAKAAAKEVLKDGAKEFAEEFAQSGPEHYLQNAAKRDYLDPTIDPSTGMLRASMEGGVVGMGQGMGMSGGAHAVNHLLTRNDPQPAKQPQPQPQPTPASTPESAAGYDPIAPNQADLLRRMGVEADPVADAAAASVESVLGAGDPTAGLVASVMRGEALQPIHDMAAVRANTVLPVGSNEGGIFEPQWLPDAEQGESANGLPMPKHGFDSQEKLLANAGLDAQDAQRKQAIDAHKQSIFATIDALQARQKSADLERLHQDSIVPAEIDRAESGNARNQALASVAGEGEAVPNAMQLAMQRAQRQGEQAKPEENTQKSAESFLPDSASDVVEQQPITSQHGIAHASTEQDQANTAPNTADQAPSIPAPAPNISNGPALTMQQTERGQWLIKGDMAQHAGAIRDALKGMNVLVSPKKGQALVAMPKDKDTAKQAKAIRKALDHLLLNGEQLAQRDAQRAQAGERMQARNKQALQVDHANDDILQAIAKMGGIDTEQALSEWWRGQSETVGHYNAEVPGNLRRQGAFAFKRGGQPIDTVIRRLEGEGYLPEGATPNDLLDAIEQRRLHPAGMEEQARREFEARQQEEQANAPGEFQQAYDEGSFSDDFTKRELEEEADYFELNRMQREAAEATAEAAEAAELDRLIDNAPVIASKSGPVTEEELDAIFGPQSRNTTAESPQADREPAAGRSMEGTESGTATAEAAPEEDGFSLASYTEGDIQRQEREAEQRRVEDERQRAAADKARQEEETRKEIRRRSEAAADTFVLGGNAEDNLTGQGGLFDAPAETESQRLKRETDALRAKAGDLIHANDHRSEDAGRALDDFNDKVIGQAEFAARLNRIEATPAPDGKNSRFEQKIKIAANGVESLRASDVGRVLEQQQSHESLQALADYITQHRPDLSGTVQRDTAALKEENGWTDGPKRGKVGMMLAPGEVVLTASGRETTPFPKFQTKTGKITTKHISDVDKWLLQNAATEALSRGDTFNAPVFQRAADNPKNISQSDKDSAEEYLFGEQPAVKPSILKPLSGANNAESQSSSAEKTAYSPENPVETPQNAASSAEKDGPTSQKLENFGEQLPPARKAFAAKLGESLSDEEIASRPLSQIWPASENDAIQEPFAAAVAHVLREAIPSKPRTAYKVKAWVGKVRTLRELAAYAIGDRLGRDVFMEKMKGYSSLDGLAAKIKLLEHIDRAQWNRIGDVGEWPNAIRYGKDGEQIKIPSVSVTIDGKYHAISGGSDLLNHLDAIKSMLTGEAEAQKMKFEIRHDRKGTFFINKVGDKEYRRLMEFSSAEDARKALRDQYADVVAAWEEVKARDNITERDLRTAENRQRVGADHRKGVDVSAEDFERQFGFRGGEFGKWVEQGKGAKDRQTFLNNAYDALMDLANILGIPPRAISLEGSLGIAFGSRGSGWASAHFEPSNLVINLTKTRGAGALAHEWFHALDNYFSRKRGGEVPFNGDNNKYRDDNYITHKPVPGMVHKNRPAYPVQKETLDKWRASNPNSRDLSEDNWMVDPNHRQGVRPEVESAFHDLVKALNDSPMLQRSKSLDGSKTGDGYWSRTLERAARAFENYVQVRMMADGYHNDFLANVRAANEVGKNVDRYPYLLQSEIAPISDAFQALFDAIQHREVDGGKVELYSKANDYTSTQGMSAKDLQAIIAKALPAHLRELVKVEQSRGNSTQQSAQSEDNDLVEADYDLSTKQITLYADAIPTPERALFVLSHELTHYGLDAKYGFGLSNILLETRNNPMIAKLANAIAADRGMTVNSVRQDIADALGISAMKVARSIAIHRLQTETANEALAELNAAIERNDFAYLQDRYGVTVPKMMRNDLRGRLARLTASVKAWLAKLTGKQATEYSDKQVWDLLAGVRDVVRGGGKLSAGYRDGAAQYSMAASSKTINIDGVTRPTTNSNGQPIAQTEEGLRNFWRWFSPSPGQLLEGLSVSEISGLKRDTEALADFIESQAGLSESDRFSVIPPSVFAHVAGAVNNDKIRDAVVRSLPVDVVNFLSGEQAPAKEVLHNAAMLENVFTVAASSDVTLAVNPSVAAELLVRTVANAGAKISGVTSGALERNTAVLADANDPILGNHIRANPKRDLGIIAGFGDSKVVDKNGKPLVVYHGSPSGGIEFFDATMEGKNTGAADDNHALGGFYFTADPNTADTYARTFEVEMANTAEQEFGINPASTLPTSTTYPVYLSIQDPAELRMPVQRQVLGMAKDSGRDGAILRAGISTEYVAFKPGQIKSAVGNQGTFNASDPNILRSTAPKQPASAGFSLPEETKAQAAQREVQDNMNRWRQVLENVREQGGQVDEQNDVYGAEERFHGRAATRIEDFARDEVEPLMQRLADSGRSLQEVEQYLLAQHAEEANARIREIDDSRDTAFGMEDGEAQSILAKFAAMPDAAEFKRLANDFRRISEGTLSLYVKAGIVSPEAAHAMRMAYQFYVPVKGGDEDQAARQGTGKGLSVNGKQKRRMGHDMRDEHVLENMLRDRQRAIILAEKNNVGTYLLDLIERNPDPKLWTVGVLPKQKVLRDQVSYVVELNGQMLDSFHSMEAARVFVQAEAARTGAKTTSFAILKSNDPYVSMMAKPTLQDHEVQVYVQGRAVRIQLHDPILAGQYRRMGTEQMGRIIEAGKSLNRWLSKVYTGYNPEFFVKNVVRDLFAGTINLTADQGAKVTARALWHWPKAGAAMFKFALTGKAPSGDYGKALQRYRAAGGSTGAAYMGDLERQANTLTELYENYTGAMATLQQGKPFKAARIAGRKLVQGLAHWFEVWNQAGENAFRLATFMSMQESGKTVAESASMAKNVTVNFNRKGELTPQLGALYLFFNPNVQGSQRLWQSLFGGDTKHKAQAWALVGSMAGAALALAMMNRGDDEDEWEAIPDSTKDRNLIIPLGNKRKLTIPLPYGYSFFVSMANRLDALMHGESAEKASIRMASSFFENFSPVGNPIGDDPKLENMLMLLPTAIKIPALPAANITDFGGPMRPDYKETQPDNEKMWRGTRGSLYDKAAQGISSLYGSPYENNWNDISPETIKYLFKTLAGGTGGFMADSASLLNVLASGSAPDVSEVPFLRSAVRESTVKDARARFYDLGKDAKGHVEAWKRAVEAGDDKAAGEYERDGELLALGQMMDGYRKQATAMRDLMTQEMQREDLTLAEKRLKQKMYESQEAEIYRDFIRQFRH